MQVNAYPAILGKLHKSPIKFRFLACSAAYELKHLSIWLSRAFSFLSTDFHRLWKNALQVEGHCFKHHLPWVCSDSKVIPTMINHLNRSIPLAERHKPVLLQSFDFSKMYTNINLEDLKNRLNVLFKKVFEKSNKLLLVSKVGSESCWSRVRKEDTTSLKCFDLEKITSWLNFLVDNIYMKFGSDVVVRQRIRIPMGTNCAVFLANYYLFTFELEFIQKLVAANRFDLISNFVLSKRYIDDCLSLNNPQFKRFALQPNDVLVEDGITGIYPSSLTLNLEQSSWTSVHFLDVFMKKHKHTWYTSIFDKREIPPLNKISNVKFPHMDSFLSKDSKYSVLTGQFHRFSRICQRRKDFIFRAKQLIAYLLAKNYKKRTLFTKALSFLRKFAFRYNISNVRDFVGRLFFTTH